MTKLKSKTKRCVRLASIALIVLLAALPASIGSGVAPASASVPAQYETNTGWVAYDGGCLAHTSIKYWAASNQIQIKTDVQDPYLFAACRVNATVYFDGTFGTVAGPTQAAMACAVLDPTCASSTTTGWQTFDNAFPLWSVLTGLGVSPAAVLNGAHISHVKA